MSLTTLQVCMESSDWLQGTIHEETGMGSSSSPSEDILTCSARPPLIERREKPPHDQALKCPRCDSTHTKFCYYNNYSLSQPRYFCKTCRRYWTKGGTLRNIPVGGGCRKNKKASSKKSSSNIEHHHNHRQSVNQIHGSSSVKLPIDHHLQLSFPDGLQFLQLGNLFGSLGSSLSNPGFMLENPAPIEFMESKHEALVGNGDLSMVEGGLSDMNFPGIYSPFGMSNMDVSNEISTETYQRLMLPYQSQNEEEQNAAILFDVKPNPSKLLSLDWHNQACNSDFGIMNGYRSSATNPLV